MSMVLSQKPTQLEFMREATEDLEPIRLVANIKTDDVAIFVGEIGKAKAFTISPDQAEWLREVLYDIKEFRSEHTKEEENE